MNLEDIIRVGTIDSINVLKGTARVRFEDLDDLVSSELQLITAKAQGNKVYFPYEIDEMVLCVFLPIQEEQGFIIGAIYNDEDVPPSISQNGAKIQMKDGSFIEIADGKMNINMVSEITITTPKLKINGDFEAGNIKAKTIDASSQVAKGGTPYIHP